MENNLEQLLNSLIEKGWKPFGYNDFTKATVEENENVPGKKVIHLWTDLGIDTESLIRIICMKESQLWQFCVENGMVKSIGSEIEIKNLNEGYGVVRDTDYQYRLIESSLEDESELESFILDNIKVDE